MTRPVVRDNTAFASPATSGSTQLVALTARQTVYVCGYSLMTNSATGVNVKLVYGTGTNCATRPADMTPAWPLDTDLAPGKVDNFVFGNGLKTAAGNALCVNLTAAVQTYVSVFYTKF